MEILSMRRITCIAMILLFLIAIVTGFAEAHIHPVRSGIHTILAILFIISTLIHVILNRKPLARYLARLVKNPVEQ
jgi:hypothetical protein